MKWLKKDSSEDVQETIAESQPEPEQQPTEQVEVGNSEPEALEQPVAPIPVSLEEDETDHSLQENEGMPAEVFEPEDENVYESDSLEFNDEEPVDTAPVETRRRSSRRRENKDDEITEATKAPGFNPLTMFSKTWIGKNWKVMAILVFIFCLALFVRSYYGVVPSTEDGFILSGGSDSYYHNFVIDYAGDTGDHHFWDDMLNYPVGTRNPRPPLYDWSVTLGGIALSPFFEDGQYEATFYVFLFSTAFWGALTIFPTYFLAKEAFGKRTGMIAAFLLAIMPGHIQRSVLTNADHDAIALFFIVTTFFFFLKALKLMQQKEWVSTWRKPDSIFSGIKDLVKANRVSLLYAVMAGLSLASVALIWKGYAYVIVIMSAYFLIQLLINKFRNVDSLGVLSIYFTAVGTGLFIAFPYYYQSIQIASWFDTPTYILLVATGFALALIVTRKLPWVLVFSGMIGLGILSIGALAILAPSLLDSLVSAVASGAGYFIQNKQYQTIAEAQAPPFSNLAMSFGMITFWLSFVGIAWAAIQLPKSWKADFTFITLWTATSIYMAVTAARFMFNAGPAFAITAGWIVALILSKLNIKKFTENFRRVAQPNMSSQFRIGIIVSAALLIVMSVVLFTISNAAYPVFVIGLVAIVGIYILNLIAETNPNKMYNLIAVLIPASGALLYLLSEFYTNWEFTSATHGFILFTLLFAYFVLYMTVRKTQFTFTAGILFLAFFIIMPNVWGGLDAGIPYEVKTDYDLEIYQSAPIFMQPSSYDAVNGSTWFLGGFGYSLPLNSRYWPAAYDWLATQDTETYPASERPAFLSWWDYGFEVVNEGKHPTVADNFLGGHQLAGNFIMSQSEEDAIALLSARIIEGNWMRHLDFEDNALDSEIKDIIQSYGISIDKMIEYLENPGDYTDQILAHPEIYGPRDDVIQDANARYILIRVLITDSLDKEEIVDLYNDLCDATGDSIRYFGIDSRLFPFSADNTGIFYAPAKLSDHRIDEVGNQPYDFWEIKAVGEFGGEYNLDEIPSDVQLDPDNPYKIVYNDMFYNSMLYKCFIGYSGEDIGAGEDAGIPGLSGSLSSDPIMPGWNMTHFKLEHRTAYWNPYSAEDIQNHTDAWQAMNFWDAYNRQQAGDGISDLSDRSSLYQGVMMLKYYDGAIISGKVTLEDGTPVSGASVTVSDEFSIPHQQVITGKDGSYSIIAPYGDITLTASIGAVDPASLIGSEMNTIQMHIEDYQAMRENEDRDNNGKPDYLIDQDITVVSGSFNGVSYWDTDGDDQYISDADQTIPNVEIIMSNNYLDFETSSTSDENGQFNLTSLPPGDYSATLSVAGVDLVSSVSLTITSGQKNTNALVVPSVTLSGTVTYEDGSPVPSALVELYMHNDKIYFSVETDETGNYTFENIIQGNFIIDVVTDGYSCNPQNIVILPAENNTNDITVYPSSYLVGTLRLPDGSPIPNAKIRFTGFTSFFLTTDEFGNFSAQIENDLYDVYAEHTSGSSTYSIINSLLINGNTNMDMYLEYGTMLNGHIINELGIPAGNMPIYIEEQDSGSSLILYSNNQGEFTATIPKGEYLIQISYNNLAYYKTLELTEKSYTIDMVVSDALLVNGVINWDGYGLDYASIVFKDPSGNFERAITDSNGTFSVYLKPSLQYKVSLSKLGFESINLGTFTAEELADGILEDMTALEVPISGTIFLDDVPLENQNIVVKFQSKSVGVDSKYVQAGRDGTYGANLSPGTYTISFIQNVSSSDDSLVYQIDEELELSTGLYDGRTLKLDLIAKLRQKVSVSVTSENPVDSNVTFEGPETISFDVSDGSGSFYVMPGNYVLKASYADNESVMVGMRDIIVSENSTNISIHISAGKEISGDLRYDSQGITNQYVQFKDMNSNGSIYASTDDLGKFEAILESNGMYNVLVDFVGYDDDLDAYRYHANQTFNASSMNQLSISLEREEHYSTISGNLSTGTAGVELVFFTLEDKFTTISDSEGHYEILLRPGVYTVYVHDTFTHEVLLETLIVDLNSEIIDLNLEKGYRVFGTAYYGLNLHDVTELNFQSNLTVVKEFTDENGFYDIWFPAGEYTVFCSATAGTDEVPIAYEFNRTFEVSDRDIQMNLAMSMIEERNVDITFDSDQLKQIRDNSTVTYSFVVKNTGNIQDTYDLAISGGSPDWVFEQSAEEVTLEAGQSRSVTVTATIPNNSKVTQNNINIIATSQKDFSVGYNSVMNVNIIPEYDISIKPVATSPTFIGGSISSEFAVYNNGNADDTYTIYIGNLDDLAESGWKAELGTVAGAELINDNSRIVNVSTVSGGNNNIKITITPIDDKPSRQASVLITGFSQIDGHVMDTHYVTLRYPELQMYSGNVTVIGEDVSTVVAGDEITNAGVMVMSVGVALALFYYARKKRWIR